MLQSNCWYASAFFSVYHIGFDNSFFVFLLNANESKIYYGVIFTRFGVEQSCPDFAQILISTLQLTK